MWCRGEFYKERNVVIEERRMRTDSNPRAASLSSLRATAYVAHNYGRSGIGWPSESQPDQCHRGNGVPQEYYVGANIVVAVVGDVESV